MSAALSSPVFVLAHFPEQLLVIEPTNDANGPRQCPIGHFASIASQTANNTFASFACQTAEICNNCYSNRIQKTRFWYITVAAFNISNDHPHHFYTATPPPPPPTSGWTMIVRIEHPNQTLKYLMDCGELLIKK